MPSFHAPADQHQSTPNAPARHDRPGPWTAGHLGALSEHLPADLIDRALEATGTREHRVRLLPARVVIYFVLALALVPHLGYRNVLATLWAHTPSTPTITASALTQARQRLGVAPLRWLFELLRGPVAATTGTGCWFGSLRICAIDGTILTLPDTPNIQTKYRKQAGHHGGTGYPQARLVSLICCGTRSIIDAVFGPTRTGETAYTTRLLEAMGPGMIILADRNFAAAALLRQIAATGAHFLVRVKNARPLPVHRTLPDGSHLSVLAGTPVRVITAVLTLETAAGARTETCRLVTSLLDPAQGTARQLIGLYHQRWEIETAFRELKSTLLEGRVLRSKSVPLVEQEIYALLIVEQLLRTVMSEATNAVPGLDPDRASFTIALAAARDQLVLGPRGPGTSTGWRALAGPIGHRVLAGLLPGRRLRTGPRTVKRAISKYQARAQKPHGPTLPARLHVEIIGAGTGLTAEAEA